jgi:AraC-like DNA-binding protein
MLGRLTRFHTVNATGTLQTPRPRLKPRGLPPALEPHGVWAASNPADAALYGRDLLGTHRVHIDSADAGRFEAMLHGVLVRDVTLGYLDYSTPVRLEVRELADNFLVIVPANGTSTITSDGRTVDCSPVRAAVPMPGAPMTLVCDADAAHLVVRIARSALEVHLSRLLGRTLDEAIRLDLGFDLSAGSSSRWNFAVQMLHAELFDETTLLHQGVGHSQLEEFVMSALLYSQTSNYTELLRRNAPPERQAVQVARDFIERNLARPISVRDIAEAADVSVRTLQNHFSEDLDRTVTGYVRDRRLERVRAELADASPTGATVTAIASRWGFNHLGRFAVVYRSRFGESPSHTLRT